MKTRILTAAVMLAVFLPILWFSDTVVYPIALGILSAVATYELLRCLGMHRDAFFSVVIVAGAALPILARYADTAEAHLATLTSVYFLLTVYLLGTAVFRPGRVSYGSLMGILGGSFYIAVAFSSLVLLRDFPNGVYLFLLPFVGSWVTDTFAYFTGRVCGRHKLAPAVSPKKTVEGSIGGVAFAVAAFILYGAILAGRGFSPSYAVLAVCGLFTSVVSQIGDLALSAIKREYGVKDYGRLFPGHGGVLDRFDSVIATAPLLLMLCLWGASGAILS